MSDCFTFDELTHTYRVGGVVIPGHTRVLDLGGLVNYRDVEPDILERKSDLGRQVHEATRLYDLRKKFTCDPLVEPYLEAWIDFRELTKFKPRLVEHRGLSEINGMQFGMQIDREGDLAGDETLVELKTCAKLLPHHGIQLAAQAAGLYHRELSTALARFMRRKRVAVQLKKDGYAKIQRYEDRSDFDAFVSALTVTHFKMRHAKHYKGELPQ